jgi:penicillin-binding protein 1A
MKLEQNIFARGLTALLSLFITFVAVGSFIFLYLDTELPNVGELKTLQLQAPMRVYTADGNLISEFGELHRTPVTFEQIPKPLINAVLATEDQRYFEHMGVDPYGLMRAFTQLVLTGTKSQGGSTITMQVARNFYLTRKKTYLRKVHEIMLAMKIERQISKEKILELYLNKIYFGSRSYGVAAAAQAYFGKTLNQLTLPEMALIGGLPKAPSALNPFVNPTAAKERRDHVLHRMLERGYIDQLTYKKAIEAPLKLSPRSVTLGIDAPYIAEMARDSLLSQLGDNAYKGGYSVYTTIDSHLQEAADNALKNTLLAYDKRHGYRIAQHNLGAYQPGVLEDWLSALSQLPPIHGMRSAAVIKVSDRLLTALLDNGQVIPVSLTWGKTALPRSTFKSGDLIRVESKDHAWELAQLPDAEAAITALDPKTGAIRALVGGFAYSQSNFNRATQAQRQPGSSFKPFIYAAALDKGYTLASIVDDAPLEISDPSVGIWRPQNNNHMFRGPVRLRVALINSINLVTIRLLQTIGLNYTIDYLTRFGFEKKQLPHALSLALGTASVTPLQMAGAYAVFANGGYRVTPYLIDRIQDRQGKVVYEAHPNIAAAPAENQEIPLSTNTENHSDAKPETTKPDNALANNQVISPQIAYLMTTVLQDVIKQGTARQALCLKRTDIAGKTGTTNDKMDAWFCGYNPRLVATVWVGFDQPRSLSEYGAQVALPMWIDFMGVALAGQADQSLLPPDDIASVNIDPKSGLVAGEGFLHSIKELFRKDTVPPRAASENAEIEVVEHPVEDEKKSAAEIRKAEKPEKIEKSIKSPMQDENVEVEDVSSDAMD